MWTIGDRIRITKSYHHHGCPKKGDVGFLIDAHLSFINKFAMIYAVFVKEKPEYKIFFVDLGMPKANKYKLLKNDRASKVVIQNLLYYRYGVIPIVQAYRLPHHAIVKYKVRFAEFVIENVDLRTISDIEFRAYSLSMEHFLTYNARPINNTKYAVHNLLEKYRNNYDKYNKLAKHDDSGIINNRDEFIRLVNTFKLYSSQYYRNKLINWYNKQSAIIHGNNRSNEIINAKKRLFSKLSSMPLRLNDVIKILNISHIYIEVIENIMYLLSPFVKHSLLSDNFIKAISGLNKKDLMKLALNRKLGSAALTRIYDVVKNIEY